MCQRLIRTAVAVGLLVALGTCSTLKVYRIRKLEFPNKSGKLKNGMRVVIQPDPTTPYVIAVMRYEIGAAFDPPGKKGLAHLVEHLAFRLGDELVDLEEPAAPTPTDSPPTTDADAAEAANADAEKKKPAKGRVLRYLVTENAYTTIDATVYWKRVVPAHLNDVLTDFAKQMGDFSTEISNDILKTEREVVRNERRSSYEGHPHDRFALDLYERFYPKGHPYQGQAVIGSHETISAIELADVSRFLAAHYHSGNATLSIVGPVDAEQTLQMVLAAFGDKPKRAASALEIPDWEPTAREEIVVVPKAKETLLTVVWPLGPQFSDEVESMRILRDSGWFWYRLVSNRNIAYWVTSGVWEQRHESMFIVRALLKSHGDVGSATSKILEIADMINADIDVEAFGKARRRHIYAKLYGAEDPRERAEAMATYFRFFDKPMGWVEELDRWHALELSDVKAVGSKILDDDRAFIMVHTPITEDAGEASAASSATEASYSKEDAEAAAGNDLSHDKRDLPPAVYDFTQPFDEFRAWADTSVERWDGTEEFTLGNGIRCRIMQAGSLPITFIQTSFVGGQLAEPKDRHGVAAIMFATSGLSGRADRSKQYRIGLHTWWNAGDERLTYGQKFLSYYIDEAFELLAQELSSPKTRRKNVVIEREKRVQTLSAADQDVDWLAARALWKARGLEVVSPIQTKESVGNVSLMDVWSYHDEVIYPENAVISVASNLPTARIKQALIAHFGSWSPAGLPARSLAKLAPGADKVPKSKGDIVIVDVDAPQSKIAIGFDGPGWSDWQAHLLMSGVASLLGKKMERLRRAMGITYGASATTWALRNIGMLWLGTKVEAGATERALKQLLAVLERFRKERVTADEVEYIKRSIITDYANAGDETHALAKTNALMMTRGRAKNHYTQVIAWVAKLSLTDVQSALDELLGQKGTLVIAGPEPAIVTDRSADLVASFSGSVIHFSAAQLFD